MQAITDENGRISCGMGRMLNSNINNQENYNSAGWSNFTQPCETANANSVRQLICGDGNPNPITAGFGMGATGGVQQTSFDQLESCWWSASNEGTTGWSMTLPVIDCPGNNVSNCATVLGAVEITIIWMARKDDVSEAPTTMTVETEEGTETWTNDSEDGQVRWNDFVDYFNLQNIDGSEAPYQKKAIYFRPSCIYSESGNTGGVNFGVLAEIPVLVQ